MVGDNAGQDTRQKFRKMLREGNLSDKEVEVEVSETSNTGMPTFDIPGMPGSQMGMINLNDMLGKSFGQQKALKRMSVPDSY